MISNNMSPTLIFCFIFVKFYLKGKVQNGTNKYVEKASKLFRPNLWAMSSPPQILTLLGTKRSTYGFPDASINHLPIPTFFYFVTDHASFSLWDSLSFESFE